MDLLLLIVAVVLGVVLSGEFFTGYWDGSHTLGLCIMLSISVWLGVVATLPQSVDSHDVYTIYAIDRGEDMKVQFYITESGNMVNVTKDVGFLLPEGSVLRRTAYNPWKGGCFCLMGKICEHEYYIPKDGTMVSLKDEMQASAND